MRPWDPLHSCIGPSDLEFPLEIDLTICESLIPCICESLIPSLHDSLDAKLTSNEDILEDMIKEGTSWEYIH